MLNIIPPGDVLLGVSHALRELVLPAVNGRNERRQCRAAAHLLELLAGEIDRYGATLTEDQEDFRRAVPASSGGSVEQLRAAVADLLREDQDAPSLEEVQRVVRRSLDRWIQLTPPGSLGRFEHLDGSPLGSPLDADA